MISVSLYERSKAAPYNNPQCRTRSVIHSYLGQGSDLEQKWLVLTIAGFHVASEINTVLYICIFI